MAQRVLRRSKRDRIVSGVCGGIAATYGFDSVLVRGVCVVLALINLPVACVLYIAAYFLVPEERADTPVPIEHPGWRYDPWTGERIHNTRTTADAAATVNPPAPVETLKTDLSAADPSETDTHSARTH